MKGKMITALRVKRETRDKLVIIAKRKSMLIGYDIKWTQLANVALAEYIEAESEKKI